MSQQLRYKRKWKDVNFNANGNETIDLPIGFDIESLHLYLKGTINVTAAYATCLTEGLAKLVRRVELLANGEVVATVPGTFLFHSNFERKAGVIKQNPGVGIAVQACRIAGFLDLAHVGGLRPKDSNLRTLGFRQLQLRVYWGALTDMYTGAGAAVPSLTLTASTYEENTVGGVGGSQAPEARRLYKYVLDKPYAAANGNERILLDPNILYRGIMLRCEDAGELSTAVLNNVKIQYGTENPIDLPASVIQDANTQDLDFVLPAGYYFVDFSSAAGGQAKVSDFLDTYLNPNAYMVLDVNGGANFRVQAVSHQFEWLPVAIRENAARRAAKR
jgi:hypothetical protein